MKYKYLNDWKKRAFARLGGRGAFLEFLFHKPSDKNDIIFDFHNHTTSSDGVRTFEMLGHEAQMNGVKKLAITDHDTIKGFDLLFENKTHFADYSGEVYSGVEITSKLGNKFVEILLLDFDYHKLKELINSRKFPYLDRNFKLERFLRLIKMRIDIVNEMKLTDKPLSLDDFVSLEIENEKGIIETHTFSELGFKSDVVVNLKTEPIEIRETIDIGDKKYKVNFDYFNSKLYKYIRNSKRGNLFLKNYQYGSKKSIDNFSEFNRLLIQQKGSPLYVSDNKYWPKVSDVCELAKMVGGVAILAHPYGYGNFRCAINKLMTDAMKAGVDGIECMHGFNEPSEIEKIYKFCYEHDLLFTAGSDTHEFYSTQGNLTEIGRIPSQGILSKHDENRLEDAMISTYNLHYVGSGAWRGDKEFDIDSDLKLEK